VAWTSLLVKTYSIKQPKSTLTLQKRLSTF
jgi:hypothetical protein